MLLLIGGIRPKEHSCVIDEFSNLSYEPFERSDDLNEHVECTDDSDDSQNSSLGGDSFFSVGQKFENFSVFESKLKEWTNTYGHPLTVKKSSKFKQAEKGIRLDSELYPYSEINYACKHGVKSRQRGNHVRPNQNYFDNQCPVRVKISLQKTEKVYKINQFVSLHNHPINTALFQHYPKNRPLQGQTLSDVKNLIDLKIGTNQTKKYVAKETGVLCKSQDVHNIRSKLRQETLGGRSQAQYLVDTVEKLVKSNPDMVLELSLDEETNELQYLYIQTVQMKLDAAKYHDVLFVDGTYKVNMEGYPLYPFLVQDGNGKGRPVAFAFVRNETYETLSAAFTCFKKRNPCISNTKIIFVDKDFTEIKLVKELWPQSLYLLCTWHVLKYLRKQVISMEKTTKETKQEVISIIYKIIHAKTEAAYNTEYEILMKTAPNSFSNYFTTNWHHCRETWAHYFRQSLPTLGNNTNNRIENLNGRLKTFLSANMHLPEALTELVSFIKNTQFNKATSQYAELKLAINTNKIKPVHLQISAKCTSAAPRLMYEQLEMYETKMKNLAIDKLVDKSFEVSTEKGTVYKINSEMNQCSCSFMATFMLPCKHIFACRDMFNFPLFAPEMVDKRWEKGHFQDNQFRMPNKNRLKLVKNSQTKLNQKPSQMTSAEKFCKASLLTKQLADLISHEGQNIFEDKMKDLEKLLSFWQKNIAYEIIEKKNCPPFDQASLKPSNTKPDIDPPSSIVTSLPLSPKVENNSTIPTNINVDTPSMKDSNPIPDISLDFSNASTFPNSDVSLDTQELKSKLVLKTQRRGRPKGSSKPYNVFSSKKDNPKPSGTKTNLKKNE